MFICTNSYNIYEHFLNVYSRFVEKCLDVYTLMMSTDEQSESTKKSDIIYVWNETDWGSKFQYHGKDIIGNFHWCASIEKIRIFLNSHMIIM